MIDSVALSMTLLVLSACATQPKKTEITTERNTVVTVESIDVPNRLVGVRDASGERTTYYVDESIRDFPRAKVGDQVRIRYRESFAVQMKKSGQGDSVTEVKKDTVKTQTSGTERGSTRTETTTTVKIEKIDRKANTVTFTGPRGRRTVLIISPKLKEFVKELNPGDSVDVAYEEAVALSLEPMSH
jgi:acetamidase/formamidase